MMSTMCPPQDAARRLVGRHDFRNMCKIDVEKMHNLERIIWHASITPHGHDSHIKPPPDACFIKRDLNAVWEEEGQAYIDHASVVVGMHEVSPHTGETTHNTGSHCAGKKHERDANACEKNNTDALPTQGDVVMTSAEGGGGRASNGEEGLPVPVGGTKQQQQQGQNTVYVVDIVGSAFLWHQVHGVRCMGARCTIQYYTKHYQCGKTGCRVGLCIFFHIPLSYIYTPTHNHTGALYRCAAADGRPPPRRPHHCRPTARSDSLPLQTNVSHGT